MTGPSPVGLDAWWRELGSVALVGTGRRPVPPPPDLGVPALALPAGVRADEALLSSAALGGMARQAGRVPEQAAGQPGQAPDDERPAAPRRAVQLLELVLTQPPAGARQRTQLLVHWLRCAADAGARLPHHLLPTALALATGQRELREETVRVLDARGAWLAAQRPEWEWATRSSPATEPKHPAARAVPAADVWARLPSTERLAVLAGARAQDPVAGRALLESTWDTDSAKDRRAHLEALRFGLGPDDEPALERALDDRAGSVREAAVDLLDALPGSARAQRMAARLRPLIHGTGLLRRGLEITLPDEPDPAAVRDGLGRPPSRRSSRGWWLERLAAGAPLDVWTTASGTDPATTLRRLSDDDALSGIRRAARSRGDAEWALALLEKAWDPGLVEVLPPPHREGVVLARLTAKPDAIQEIGGLLGIVPAPWTAEFSDTLVALLRSAKHAAPAVGGAVQHLVDGLHPRSLGAIETWLDDAREDPALTTHLRHLLQYHSVKRSITEAFT